MELQKIIEIAEFHRSLRSHAGTKFEDNFKYEIGDIIKNEGFIHNPLKIVVAMCPDERKLWVTDYEKDGTIGDTIGFMDLNRGQKTIVGNILDVQHVLVKMERLEKELEELKKELF